MSLVGELSQLHSLRHCGRVLMHEGPRVHWIQMHAGLISGARCDGTFDPLGNILARQGRIGSDDLTRCLERMTGTERPQGQLLCELGLVTLREVELALRDQLARRMSRLLEIARRPGCRYTRAQDAPRGLVGPSRPLHPYSAIWDHIRRLSDAEVTHLLGPLRPGELQVRPGARLPLFLPELDVGPLPRSGRISLAGLPAQLRRPVLLLRELGILVPCAASTAPRPAAEDLPEAAQGVLQLPRGASRQEIRRAYFRLALQIHPDRHPHASAQKRSSLAQHFARATEAYQVLMAN